MHRIFIIGCGSVGREVANQWLARGAEVTALARSDETAGRLQALGIDTVAGDLDQRETLTALSLRGQWLYYFAPPPAHGRQDARMHNLLSALPVQERPERVVYISTSGVYGDCEGEWVDETRAPHPQADRAHRRLDAERQLQQWCEPAGVPLTLLRVAGIYGPHKLPRRRLQQGTPVLLPEFSGYSNRIHIEDLVTVCLAAVKGKSGTCIYNVSDGHPGTMSDYFFAVADALGLSHPPAITPQQAQQQLSPAMLEYLSESRRLDNQKMLQELGVVLRYPTLTQGLAALAETS